MGTDSITNTKNIIFDLDGTLIDSSEDIINCLEKAYKDKGFDMQGKIPKNTIGPSIAKMIKNLTPDITDRLHQKIIINYGKYYDVSLLEKTKLKDGIKNLLEDLKKQEFSLFVITNNSKASSIKILKKLGIADYFLKVLAPEKREDKHPTKIEMFSSLKNEFHLSSENTIAVGDGESDVIAARENNLISIAVLDGYRDEESLSLAKPNYIIKKTKGLIKFLE